MIGHLDLSDKTIFITGADGNIATEVNLALAKQGAQLVFGCYSVDKCATTKDMIVKQTGISPDKITVESLDLSSEKSIRALAGKLKGDFDHLDALINSAGSGSLRISEDGYVSVMEINVLGPALLTEELLPLLRGSASKSRGRIVNVAAAVYGTEIPQTVEELTRITQSVDPVLNSTGEYFSTSKYLLIHHGLELAKREPMVAAFSLNPGYSVEIPGVPQQLLKEIEIPKWMKPYLPTPCTHIYEACAYNFPDLNHCPELYEEAAAVTVVAAVWPGIESFSGSYLDFATKTLSPSAP